MRVLITGGTGLIGTALTERFVGEGYHVIIVTRDIKLPARSTDKITYINNMSVLKADASPDVIINLAGAPISRRWTKEAKYQLIDSRVKTTRNVANFIQNAEKKPRVLISGSAIGYYGTDEKEEFTEESTPHHCFTHEVCYRWEKEAESAKDYTRVCFIRTGIVLTPKGGALKQMLPAYRLGLGGMFGNGNQWMSWIHIDDMVRIVEFLIENEEIKGAVNATSPNPATNREFTKTLGYVINRATFLSLPRFVLILLFGQMAKALLLNGQKVMPKKLTDAGFKFNYPKLEDALNDLLARNS